MKATKYVLYALTALVVFSGTLFAEATQSFGYVNVADALLLHPTIRHFDPVSKRFKLEALKGVNPEKRLEQNKEVFKALKERTKQDFEGKTADDCESASSTEIS